MDSKRLQVLRRAAPLLGALALLGMALLAYTQTSGWSEHREFARMGDAAVHQLELYAAVLDTELGKESDLPGLIDADGEIDAMLAAPEASGMRIAVNRRLTRFVARSGALWASVVDRNGRVLASSDWYRPDSQLDHVVANEPCIAEALGGQDARRFTPDPLTNAPEVCFARPLLHDGATVGAVAVRISLEPMEATWIDSAVRPDAEKPIVVDGRGIVIMSSVPGWKQRPLEALAVRERTLDNGSELMRMRANVPHTSTLQVVNTRPLPRFGWRLLILSSADHVQRDARAAAWSAAFGAAGLWLLAVLLLQRRRVIAQKLAARAALQRANDELEAKVRLRTAELEASNRELRREVAEREHAEQVLRRAQEDLVQAGKLALLGQLSAGISHELGQPLTALRALAENGRLLIERGRSEMAEQNFASITGLAERMGRITSQLKSFARKAPAESRALPLAEAIANAQQLIAPRLRDEHVDLQISVPPTLQVLCDGHRLEQVLLNLMANAVDAMRSSEPRRLAISAETRGPRVHVRVADSGPGIPPALIERLFEPFFTTKPPGEGLGLGLVISSHIVREFGGALRAVPSPSGAVFEFDVALAVTAPTLAPAVANTAVTEAPPTRAPRTAPTEALTTTSPKDDDV